VLRFAADENFNNVILRGLLRRRPDLDVVRVQDVGLTSADDPTVLRWAAREHRVLLTHDVTTMIRHAYDLVRDGEPMAGVLEVRRAVPVGQAIEEILLAAECSTIEEWIGQVRFLPF
jgi:predicted nuclease of predicted toxin-antitoxin system